MAWPNIRDFSNALLNPDVCFNDSELAEGQVELHPVRRTPVVWPGNFASVYKITAADRQNFAVRCFTREVRDHESRYNRLSQYLKTANPPGFVEFDYQPKGIRVGADWYPIVKMEWVNGQTLDKFVENNLPNPSALKRISDQWREIAGELQRLPAAHNDLQHGNIIIQPDKSIRLVDYDGIFLPQFQGNDSPEIGHSNFQHPQRSSSDYAAHIDNFPALVIYLSLLAVAADPGLWKHYNDDNLIFTKNDFAQPQNSSLFQTLQNNGDATITHLAVLLESCCARPIAETPTLENALSGTLGNRSATRDWFIQRAAGSKPSVPTERLPIPHQTKNFASAIRYGNFFQQICQRLVGQELITQGRTAFIIKDVSESYIDVGEQRLESRDVHQFLARFSEIQSWDRSDYKENGWIPTYCLPILRKYADEYADNIFMDLLKSYGDMWRIQIQATEAKVAAEQKLIAAQDAQRKTELGKAYAEAELHRTRSELQEIQRQAGTYKVETDRKLNDALIDSREARQQAANDKNEADKKLKAAQNELRSVQRQTADTEQELQTAQAKLQATQRQAILDNAEANKQLQTERGTRLKAESDTAEANKQLQTERGARLKAESDTAAANIRLQAEQAARSQAEADKAAADQKLQETQAELQALRDAPAKKKGSLFDLRFKRRK